MLDLPGLFIQDHPQHSSISDVDAVVRNAAAIREVTLANDIEVSDSDLCGIVRVVDAIVGVLIDSRLLPGRLTDRYVLFEGLVVYLTGEGFAGVLWRRSHPEWPSAGRQATVQRSADLA